MEALRALYRVVLEEDGPFRVVAEAADGHEAIEAAADTQPDVVLLDLSMPGMDGLDALPRILQVSPSSDVVILSGFLERRLGEEARSRGAVAYLEKGLEPGDLIDQLVEVLGLNGHAKPVQDPAGAAAPTPPPEQPAASPRASPTPSDQEIESFAFAASHDLQEPLRMVRSYMELLDRRYGEDLPEEAREFVAFARDGAERMQAMVDGLLAYTRLKTRAQPHEETDLEEVLDDALAALSLTIQERDATVERGSLPSVVADSNQMVRLFQNLLSNAIKYHPDQPTVRVAATEEPDAWILSVADDGPGIPPDERERIFAMFGRGSAARDVDGTGLGLAMCTRIVEAHDGEIWVRSQEGQGATFFVRLPKQGKRDDQEAPATGGPEGGIP